MLLGDVAKRLLPAWGRGWVPPRAAGACRSGGRDVKPKLVRTGGRGGCRGAGLAGC